MVATWLVLAAFTANAAAQSSSLVLSGTNTGDISDGDYASGSRVSYQSYTSTVSLTQTSASLTYISGIPTSTANSTSTAHNVTITTNGSTIVTASATETLLTASRNSSTSTGTSTSSSTRPTNTQPCNGYPEFCERSYSNITMVAAHNSPFSIQGNVASNQALDVTTQLNDGIRMLQFQVHKPNASSPLLLCHTSCDLLNAGTLVDYLTKVRKWLDQNPYDILTILMGNYDFIGPNNFTDPVYNSGMNRYLYTPPTVPMGLDQWPTLGEMIITQHRVVMMLDYQANQTAIPWLLDEFANMWETPFSPTDRAFPCTVDRPPNQDRNTSSNRLYMANHNLNVDVQVAGLSLLIPAFTLLNETNAVAGFGSAGNTSQNCTNDWDRPPNFILVDYYNIGNFNGSVFQVAANANNVTYNRDSCCGNGQRVLNAASAFMLDRTLILSLVAVVGYLFM